jgi:hypothetical protein
MFTLAIAGIIWGSRKHFSLVWREPEKMAHTK